MKVTLHSNRYALRIIQSVLFPAVPIRLAKHRREALQQLIQDCYSTEPQKRMVALAELVEKYPHLPQTKSAVIDTITAGNTVDERVRALGFYTQVETNHHAMKPFLNTLIWQSNRLNHPNTMKLVCDILIVNRQDAIDILTAGLGRQTQNYDLLNGALEQINLLFKTPQFQPTIAGEGLKILWEKFSHDPPVDIPALKKALIDLVNNQSLTLTETVIIPGDKSLEFNRPVSPQKIQAELLPRLAEVIRAIFPTTESEPLLRALENNPALKALSTTARV